MRPVPRLCCLAAMTLFGATAPAWAQSSVQIYGLLDVSAGQFQNAGGLKLPLSRRLTFRPPAFWNWPADTSSRP